MSLSKIKHYVYAFFCYIFLQTQRYPCFCTTWYCSQPTTRMAPAAINRKPDTIFLLWLCSHSCTGRHNFLRVVNISIFPRKKHFKTVLSKIFKFEVLGQNSKLACSLKKRILLILDAVKLDNLPVNVHGLAKTSLLIWSDKYHRVHTQLTEFYLEKWGESILTVPSKLGP